MTSISHGLRTWIAAHVAVVAANASVHISLLPQELKLPLIHIERGTKEDYVSLDGGGAGSLIGELFNLTVYSSTDAESLTIAEAIEASLRDYEGAMGTDRVCEAVYIDQTSGDYSPPEVGDAFEASLSIFIQHSPAPEPTPDPEPEEP